MILDNAVKLTEIAFLFFGAILIVNVIVIHPYRYIKTERELKALIQALIARTEDLTCELKKISNEEGKEKEENV